MAFLERLKGRGGIASFFHAFLSWGIFFAALAGYVALNSLLPERAPGWLWDLFSEKQIEALEFFPPERLLWVSFLGFLSTPLYCQKVLIPFFRRKWWDQLAWMATLALASGAIYLIVFFNPLVWNDKIKGWLTAYFPPWMATKDVKSYVDYLSNLLVFLSLVAFSVTSEGLEYFWRSMRESFHEARFFTWPDPAVIARFVVMICMVSFFFSWMISFMDWVALRAVSYICSWVIFND